jgi:DNA-binding XRE family transcriptional regulator
VINLNVKPKLKIRDPQKFKHLLAMAGMKQSSLADEVSVTHNYIYRVVSGGESPSPELALAMTEVINKRLKSEYVINDLFFDSSVKKNATV